MKTANETLRDLYLDYVNNYLTVDKFADDNGIHATDARRILAMGKVYHEDYAAQSDRVDIHVWFRKFEDGDVIALWDDGSASHGTLSSYQHIGQHSDASRALVGELPRATRAEYLDLYEELQARGYNVYLAE